MKKKKKQNNIKLIKIISSKDVTDRYKTTCLKKIKNK